VEGGIPPEDTTNITKKLSISRTMRLIMRWELRKRKTNKTPPNKKRDTK